MVGREYSSILEGVSDEHEYLYSARPFIFAKDIDGDIIINDTSNLDLEVWKSIIEVGKLTEGLI